jgi:hypothetical protein
MLRWEKQLENQFWRIEVSYEIAANKFFEYRVLLGPTEPQSLQIVS